MQTKQKLSEDDLERLIDALEKVHHAEIQKHPEQWANLIGSPLMARYLLLHLKPESAEVEFKCICLTVL